MPITMTRVEAVHAKLTRASESPGTQAFFDRFANYLDKAGADRVVIEVGSINGVQDPEHTFVGLHTLQQAIACDASPELQALILEANKAGATYLFVSPA
jgi:hypothetical protein